MKRRDVLVGLVALVPTIRVATAQAGTLFTLHRVAASATVRAPLQSVDLAAWAFQLTSDEYVQCAPNEHNGAVQAQLPDGRRVFVSVETISGNFMTHHYIADIAARDHLRAVSSNSQVWSKSGGPSVMRVTWELKLAPFTAKSCRLTCEVLVETSDSEMAVYAARRPSNVQNPVQVHCSVETPMFASDMERKALRGIYSSRG